MGKKAKEHRKKIANRNAQVDSAKKKAQKGVEKARHNFLMEYIEKEKAAGRFNIAPKDETTVLGVPTPILTEEDGYVI